MKIHFGGLNSISAGKQIVCLIFFGPDFNFCSNTYACHFICKSNFAKNVCTVFKCQKGLILYLLLSIITTEKLNDVSTSKVVFFQAEK